MWPVCPTVPAVLTQVMDILKRFEQKGYKLVAMKVGLTAGVLPAALFEPWQ